MILDACRDNPFGSQSDVIEMDVGDGLARYDIRTPEAT